MLGTQVFHSPVSRCYSSFYQDDECMFIVFHIRVKTEETPLGPTPQNSKPQRRSILTKAYVGTKLISFQHKIVNCPSGEGEGITGSDLAAALH